ncbi:MAG: asparagine--tRNA ligase [Deltaproteobacteria bacterium]|nr:asparagine--tRNA ligase [Deltaproteobacteria bacterium]MBW1956190.1 asparagine--tRNA ligase [Deltaproteobacteria bacterium]MBW2042953.1 asparagine--tRNA ligase [Deltaproteobacteria bacterium]MBW2132548.1 asparagine--tRNA ligase [Deltaproteobacteria bacterium]
MNRTRVKAALTSDTALDPIRIQGWVRTRRDSKGFSFLEINDGSCLKNIQVIVEHNSPAGALLKDIQTGASVEVTGALVESPGKGQKWEVKAREVTLFGTADPESYPLQKKRHSDEFLRTIAHLRPRTNKYGALFRIRSESAFSVHQFFRDRGFFYLQSPIITGSDCEGAGELFRVTTLPPFPPAGASKTDVFQEDFFGKEAGLTVSGQLEAELFTCALGNVYTFGPTFRAENSNTPRHAAEFWMIEPEMAFADLSDNMDLAEDLVKHMTRHVVEKCPEDLELFARFVDKDLMENLDAILNNTYVRLPYAEAVQILEKSGKPFEFPVKFGADLQTEHERYLCETHFKKPVLVYDYPKEIKAFYMRLNDDGTTVAAMDLLVPRVGELVGGSQREERYEVLHRRILETGMDPADYWWYLDIRRYGTVYHSGFGLGFERFLMMVTGVTNIRDVIPFPRTPKHLEF